MMAEHCSFRRLAVALSFALSLASVHASALARDLVEPAATLVPDTAAAGAPLLRAETLRLTEGVLQRLKNDAATAEHAHLFAFANAKGTTSRKRQSTSGCKTYPGDAEWPSSSLWDLFNALLDKRLIPTKPIAAPCYDSQWGSKDLAKCNTLLNSFQKPITHEVDPTSIMWPIFQGRTCMVRNDTSAADKCTIGGLPEYAVNVSNVAQIQLAVNFARESNLRLVVKNTGHDYLGKSSGAGSLGLWMYNLKDIEYLPDYKIQNFSGKAFKVGAGVTVQEIYRAAEAQGGLSVSGGICESVGFVGGYLQGGGHSPLSGYYGMGADNVLALQVVLPSGEFVTASETSYPDLFWALRGGGGGTYGIVTSAIVRAHPKMGATHSTFILGNSTDGKQLVSRENFWKGVRKYWESFPEYTDAGTYSFFFIFNTNGQLTLDMKAFFAPNHTKESYDKLTKPWMDTIKDLGIPFQVAQNSTYYDTFFPAYWSAWGQAPFPLGTANSLVGNRLLPKSYWTDPAKLNATWDVLKTHVETGRHFGCYHQSPGNKLNVNNSVSSVWRQAQSFFITSSPQFPENSSTTVLGAANRNLSEVILKPWRELAPFSQGGGSYLNEASVDEPNWQTDFYGSQYSQLLSIKKKYDPYGLLYVTTGVGSEDWEVRDGDQGVTTQNGRLCKK